MIHHDEDEHPGPDCEGPMPWEVEQGDGLTPEETAACSRREVDRAHMLMWHLSSIIRDARLGAREAEDLLAIFDDGSPLAGTEVEPNARIRPDQVDPYETPSDEPDPSDPDPVKARRWSRRLNLYGPDGLIAQSHHRTIARAIAPAFPFRVGDIVDFDDGRRVWRCKVSDVNYRELVAEVTRDRRSVAYSVPFAALEFIRRSTRRELCPWQFSLPPRRRRGAGTDDGNRGEKLAPPGA